MDEWEMEISFMVSVSTSPNCLQKYECFHSDTLIGWNEL